MMRKLICLMVKRVGAVDVAALMVLMKVARSKGPRKHADNFVDICGYAALACEMQEGN